MIRAHTEIVDFIASGSTFESVAGFSVSRATKDRVADLIRREKTSDLTAEESSALDHFLKIEHLMRLAKSKARSKFSK